VVRLGDDALNVTGTTTDAVGALATANGMTLRELSAHQASLEQRYLELTSDSVDFRPAVHSGVTTAK